MLGHATSLIIQSFHRHTRTERERVRDGEREREERERENERERGGGGGRQIALCKKPKEVSLMRDYDPNSPTN